MLAPCCGQTDDPGAARIEPAHGTEASMTSFPSLDGFGPTRKTLHHYAQAINAIARLHAVERPLWWHTSLKVTGDRLASDPMPLPSGDQATFLMSIPEARIVLKTGGEQQNFPMDEGWSGSEMGEALISAVGKLGLTGEYNRDRFSSDSPGVLEPEAAQRFHRALVSADSVLKKHQASLSGETSPVQLWPHNFDLSLEWFSGQMVPHEVEGETRVSPAQLNLGFFPGDDDATSYFYSNPWPFVADRLLGQPLPEGAYWHTDGWEGTKLPYALLVDRPDVEKRLLAYTQAVFAVAAPTLQALA